MMMMMVVAKNDQLEVEREEVGGWAGLEVQLSTNPRLLRSAVSNLRFFPLPLRGGSCLPSQARKSNGCFIKFSLGGFIFPGGLGRIFVLEHARQIILKKKIIFLMWLSAVFFALG